MSITSLMNRVFFRLSAMARSRHVRRVIRRGGSLYVQAWQAIDQNDPDAAAGLLDEMKAQAHGVPDEDILMLEASIMGLRGLHDQCVNFLERIIGDHRSSLDLTLALAWNYMKVGTWRKALDTYSASLEMKGVDEYEDEIRDSIALCREKLTCNSSNNTSQT